MKQGDVILATLRQVDGSSKERPALFLTRMPPFQDVLVCGISTQVRHKVEGFDEFIAPDDAGFRASGLRAASIFRLGYLAVLPRSQIKGRIGNISSARLNRLLTNLADFLRPSLDL